MGGNKDQRDRQCHLPDKALPKLSFHGKNIVLTAKNNKSLLRQTARVYSSNCVTFHFVWLIHTQRVILLQCTMVPAVLLLNEDEANMRNTAYTADAVVPPLKLKAGNHAFHSLDIVELIISTTTIQPAMPSNFLAPLSAYTLPVLVL